MEHVPPTWAVAEVCILQMVIEAVEELALFGSRERALAWLDEHRERLEADPRRRYGTLSLRVIRRDGDDYVADDGGKPIGWRTIGPSGNSHYVRLPGDTERL